MIFVTCLWRKILKYINSSCFSVQIPDNWKLIAVFSVLSKLSYKNPVGEMNQMDLSSPDQHDTVCSGTAGTVRPVTCRDPAVLIKLFLTSAHMTAGHVSCDINTSCRMQHAHQQWRAGPTAWQEQWTNQQQEQQWSVWHVVISCSHTGSTQCVSTLTTAGCLRKHVVKKQVYLQPITAPVSQGVTEGSLLSALRFITLPLRHMIRWWHDLHLHQSCTESCCPDKGPVREPQSQSRPQICLFIFPPPYVCFSEA